MRVLIADDHGIVRTGIRLLLECQPDRSAILLAELRVNIEMGAADQGPSAIGSAAAGRHKNSQHQDGNVLHNQTIASIGHEHETGDVRASYDVSA